MTGTEKSIGFKMASQRPLNELFLNEGAPWADEAEVLAGIDIAFRSPGLLVNIDSVLYWFDEGLTTLSTVYTSSAPDAVDVPITDTGGLYDATEVEAALAEVMTAHNALQAEVDGFGTGTEQTLFRINLTAQSTVAARVAAATETTDYPTGWVLAASSVVNLLVTHTLTGRNIASVQVWEIDGATERLLVPFSSAFSGVLGNTSATTVLIEGLAPTVKAIRIILTFY